MARPRKVERIEEEHGSGLNLAPIIDCFTVLIMYLLVSASFISMGVLEVSAPVETALARDPADASKLPVRLDLRLRNDKAILLEISGAESGYFTIASQGGGWDTGTLRNRLQELRTRFPALDTAMVGADEQVVYKDVVQAVETIKEEMPHVFFANSDDTVDPAGTAIPGGAGGGG